MTFILRTIKKKYNHNYLHCGYQLSLDMAVVQLIIIRYNLFTLSKSTFSLVVLTFHAESHITIKSSSQFYTHTQNKRML